MLLLRIYLRPEWPRATLLGALLLVGIGLQLANPQIVRVFIDHAQAGEPIEQLVWIALLFIGVALLTQLATVAETYVAEDLGWRTTNSLRVDLTRHVLELDASFHAEHSPGELLERIDGDVSAIADFFARFVVQVLGSGLFLVGVLVLLFAADWRIGALLGVCVAAALVFMLRGGAFVTARERIARRNAAELSSYLEERLGGLVDLKSNGADVYVMGQMQQRLGQRFDSVRASVQAASIFNSTVGVIFVLGAGGALALSISLFGAGAISVGGVYAVFRYTTMLRQPLDRLALQMNTFLRASGAMVRVGELMSTATRLEPRERGRLPAGALAVELDGVSFAYEMEAVLHKVSCCLEPAEVLGLLGRTGSGKTTIARLLFRMHDPLDGMVRVGGVDLRKLELEGLRERVGLVTQNVQLFHATLRDNVTLFDPSVTDDRLLETFAELELGEWLEGLPLGFDTTIGPGERGLSAGEAQLVALARIFLKQPGLVILDEASSRLDPVTEALLERAISRLLDGRTGVVIAHRLATVQRADRIMILDGGCVIESGRRVQLMQDPTSQLSLLMGNGLAEALA